MKTSDALTETRKALQRADAVLCAIETECIQNNLPLYTLGTIPAEREAIAAAIDIARAVLETETP